MTDQPRAKPQPSSGEDGAAYWKTEWQRVRKSESQLRAKLTAAEQRVEGYREALEGELVTRKTTCGFVGCLCDAEQWQCRCKATGRTKSAIQHAPECILAQPQQEQE